MNSNSNFNDTQETNKFKNKVELKLVCIPCVKHTLTVDQFVKTLLKIDLFLFANLLVFITLMLLAGFADVWIIYIYAVLMLVYMVLILLTLCSKDFSTLDPYSKLKRLQQFQTFRTWLMVVTILAVFASTILFCVFAYSTHLFRD